MIIDEPSAGLLLAAETEDGRIRSDPFIRMEFNTRPLIKPLNFLQVF
jgi:hypothetical protein